MARSRHDTWVFAISILVGIGGILYGYDIGVVSGALFFIKKTIPMSTSQAGVIVGAVLGGGLVGTLIAGPLADLYGRRFVIGLSSLIFITGVGCILLAHSFVTMLVARLGLGVGVGIVAVAVPLYVAELVPAKDRGKYVTFFQLFLTFGIVLAYFVDLAFTPSGNWRAMFGVVLIPAVILLIGMFFLPETPRWLLTKGRKNQAIDVLRKTHAADKVQPEMNHILDSLKSAQGDWRDFFNARLMLPLFIAVGIAILNQLTGINSFLQYAPHILKAAGLGSNKVAMLGSAGIGILNFICTLISIFLVDRIGRRPLLIFGVTGIIVSEVFLGIVNMPHAGFSHVGLLSLIGLFGFIVSYAIGPGVVVWLAISELFPTAIRGKGIAICLFFNSLAGTLLASLFLNITHELGVSGTYWLCAFFTLFYLLMALFYLPETKSQSLEEIQEYFEDKLTESSQWKLPQS
ncbi:MAG: MFS transporter [Coxiella sp. (in: Bacteria)]|nr:MAG: MFS transporter [Coxiella sp. (in: g-proteobacteria)]